MDAILMIVLIAAAGLILLFVYDKRGSIISFFKERFFKPKPVKLPKIKPPKDITKENDPDTQVKTENVSFGTFTMPEDQEKPAENFEPKQASFFGNTIFDPSMYEEDDDDEFDIDQMLQEIEDERRESDIKRYASEILDGEPLPDFESMSIGELDAMLEDGLDSDVGIYKDYLPIYENDELSGAELGETIKSLPRSIKILIVSDIFNRKY